MPPAGRCSRRGPASATTRRSAVRSASAPALVPQSTAAAGRSAPRRATSTIQATHRDASVPSRWPPQGQTSPTSPPASPSTVAGPTAGAAARLATTATRLTWPEMAATSGVQASWAVAGTAIASASQRGSQRARASRHPGASRRIPAVATTESAKPDARRQARIDEQERHDGRAQRPGAALSAVGAHRQQADRAHRRRPHHARLGPREQHEADDPRGPDGVQPAAADPAPPRERPAGSRPRGSGWCRRRPAGG